MDQNCETRVDTWPSAELSDWDGESNERGRRQQPYLEISEAAGGLEGTSFEDERKGWFI